MEISSVSLTPDPPGNRPIPLQMLTELSEAVPTRSHDFLSSVLPSHFKQSQIYTVPRRTPVASSLLTLPLSQNAWPQSISHPLSSRGFIQLSEPCFIIPPSCSPVSLWNCFLAMLQGPPLFEHFCTSPEMKNLCVPIPIKVSQNRIFPPGTRPFY